MVRHASIPSEISCLKLQCQWPHVVRFFCTCVSLPNLVCVCWTTLGVVKFACCQELEKRSHVFHQVGRELGPVCQVLCSSSHSLAVLVELANLYKDCVAFIPF